ncbi:hypothetical protein BCR37DRAFT_347513 [Protomyces lactucae-debilis]|uniref:SET domain-containing protein n=1 Tax=Protomyces lactucae-debilis TaxID=2754530 RepID=A0A1Y2FF24_PROLT|nr:uncharacterized protein BCR37DRAFT_347513 [Protomyces lactucae-debilis]ORY82004.1 hypothetical protein BCR37DRAFT_347513 [Protomyces lactucae-debilis]
MIEESRAALANVKAAADTPPRGWPPGLIYIRAPVHSRALTNDAETLCSLFNVKDATSLSSRLRQVSRTGPSPTKIQAIKGPSHPAYGQNGLFASRSLPPGAHVLDYLGLYHLSAENDTDLTSDYDLALRDGSRCLYLGIDASKLGNEARMMNDYRGVASAPTCVFRTHTLNTGELRMGVFVVEDGKRKKGLAKGDEILVSYGKGFWKARQSD